MNLWPCSQEGSSTGKIVIFQFRDFTGNFLGISQSNRYKMGSETLRVSNFSPIMGFTASFDTQAWVKYWFLEPSNVSATKELLCISHKMGIKWVLNTQNLSRNDMLLCISQSMGIKWVTKH